VILFVKNQTDLCCAARMLQCVRARRFANAPSDPAFVGTMEWFSIEMSLCVLYNNDHVLQLGDGINS